MSAGFELSIAALPPLLVSIFAWPSFAREKHAGFAGVSTAKVPLIPWTKALTQPSGNHLVTAATCI